MLNIAMKVAINKFVAIFVSLVIALTGLILFSCPENIFSQTIEDELEEVKNQREETQKKIEEAKAAEQRYIVEISEVESQLLAALAELNELRDQQADAQEKVEKTNAELVVKEEELKAIEKELKENIEVLNNRVSYIYKNGANHILELLLDVKDFVQFTSNLKLVNLFAEQGNDNVHQVKDKKNAVMTIKKVMIELRDKQKQHEEEVSQLVAQSEEKASYIEGLYGQKKVLLSQTRSNKEQLIKMEAELAEKEDELIKILESYQYGMPPAGELLWPTKGILVSGFGYRIHPIFRVNRFHSGIDIGASYGAPVVAAAGGEVIQSGYFGGYGYSVMLYHGGGYATWYAHLSSINVSMGQLVKRGGLVGRVGSTGWSTGPHLHFEIRIKGAAQNPMEYLP
jgi:murein DD-endopeptidase MepM/ murein hydrolase activator NlpD